MNKLEEMFKVSEIHAKRITLALIELKPLFPLNQEKVLNLSNQNLLWIELLISRFSKLQDFIGRKMIDEFLRMTKDYSENLTMVEKLNKLECLEIIESPDLWEQMREARNHIAHEYPDEPALTAKYLNQIFYFAPKLLQILDRIKNRIISQKNFI